MVPVWVCFTLFFFFFFNRIHFLKTIVPICFYTEEGDYVDIKAEESKQMPKGYLLFISFDNFIYHG